jgi:hypothetical protein
MKLRRSRRRRPSVGPLLFVLIGLLYLSPAAPGGEEPVSVVEQELALLRHHKLSEVTSDPGLRQVWWDMIWRAWPADAVVPDFTDFDKSRWFPAPPAPGVHPRLFLRPEQLQGLRTKLSTTNAGQVAWAHYREECRQLYEKPGVRDVFEGLVQDRRGAPFEKLYRAHIYETAIRMMWESLRILIDDDRAAGERLARAMVHYTARMETIFREKEIGRTNYFYAHIRELPDYMKEKTLGDMGYQECTGLFQEYCIAPMYDFNYGFMSEEQRAAVRTLIAKLTREVWIHGMGIPDTGGNWGPHHWKGANAAIVIEGEEGFDPDTVRGLKQVMNSFFSTDFTREGVIWEGLGKGTFGSHGLPTAALRGWEMAGYQPIRRAVSEMMIHSRQPFADTMVALGGLGRSQFPLEAKLREVLPLKYLYPDDPVIDYIYRLAVGEKYEHLAEPYSTHYAVLRQPIFDLLWCTDYRSNASRAEQFTALKLRPAFFCPQFSLLSARSDWGPDASWLYFWSRTYNYGHTRDDRGAFVFSALGREWATYPFGRGGNPRSHSYDAQNCSVTTIDNVGTLGQPTKMIAHTDSAPATFATADVKHAWDWKGSRADRAPDRISPLTLAALTPLETDPPLWFKVPFSLYPHWRNPGVPSGPDTRVPHYPVRHAYRTVGIVRGAHAYALILDDLKKDGEERLYGWNLALPGDVTLEGVEDGTVTLGETGGQRKLMVRILQAAEDGRGADGIARIRLEQYDGGVSWSKGLQRLAVTCKSAGVRLKVLLFAYRPGDALPETAWEGDRLRISWNDQRDVYDFTLDGEDMTVFTLRRGQSEVTLSPKHVPLPGRPPGAEFARGYEKENDEEARRP